MVERLRIPYGDGEWQFGELWLPRIAPRRVRQAVVLVHGGFWRKIYGLDLMDPLAADSWDGASWRGTSSTGGSASRAEVGRGP